MDLNALIAQGGTQNVQPPNQLDLYTKAMALQHAQNQNALAQYSLSSAQRADQEANALRQGIPADFDINNPAHRSALIKLSPVGGAALIEKLSKADQEMTMSGKHRADTTKTLQDVQSQAMRDMVSDPSDDNVKRVIGDLVRQRVLTPERGQAALDRTLSMTPQQRIDNWVTLGVPAKDLAAMLQPKPEKIDTGAAIEMRDMNPRSSTFGKQLPQFGEPIAKGQTPDARLHAEVAVAIASERENRIREEGRLNRDAQNKAPTVTTIVDPTNPDQMISIDARRYAGGGMGSPGVIGVSGKEPGAATRKNKREEGQSSVLDSIEALRASYGALDASGDMPSTKRGALSNVGSSITALPGGQAVARAVGTEAQSHRDVIKSGRLQLLNAIKQASGMSAQQLNSNVELQTWLNAVSDPYQAKETVDQILDQIATKYGGGVTAPKPTAGVAVGTVDGGYRFKGGDPAQQSNWEKVK